MELYTFLRELADSWVLLALTLFFLGMMVWVFRPGSKLIQQDAADVIFRNDKKPGPVPAGSVPGPSKEA
ncbi:CcoQ/FixQ family Cbb3-type cytochrome c oxidase assembly chaperone [bacterium]|nr:CcoQ/FixQ family Cbb3-type cytochrome c oxidase assembly chaperone [bacterium]